MSFIHVPFYTCYLITIIIARVPCIVNLSVHRSNFQIMKSKIKVIWNLLLRSPLIVGNYTFCSPFDKVVYFELPSKMQSGPWLRIIFLWNGDYVIIVRLCEKRLRTLFKETKDKKCWTFYLKHQRHIKYMLGRLNESLFSVFILHLIFTSKKMVSEPLLGCKWLISNTLTIL